MKRLLTAGRIQRPRLRGAGLRTERLVDGSAEAVLSLAAGWIVAGAVPWLGEATFG